MLNQRKVEIGCTLLLGTDKKGVLTPDADGYYTLVLGAYNAYNSTGMFYDMRSAAPFFEPGSVLMRRMEKGVVRGEYKHPAREPHMSDQAFIARIKEIDSDRVCCHIRKVYFGKPMRDDEGRMVTPIIGEIRPSGPYGQVLKDALDNPHENVYFSVRSLTVDDMVRGVKYTRDIVTWDFVNEGGIFNANKYMSPALESFADATVEVTPTLLWGLAEEQKRTGTGLESGDLNYMDLAKELGWEKLSSPKSNRPIYGSGW